MYCDSLPLNTDFNIAPHTLTIILPRTLTLTLPLNIDYNIALEH